MKATELRIGNLVYDNGIVAKVSPIIIENLYVADRKWLEPIPLTEEWLLKGGFELCVGWDDMEYYAKDDIHLYITLQGFEDAIGLEIKYVHKLQNYYYAKTDKELQFNLNEYR